MSQPTEIVHSTNGVSPMNRAENRLPDVDQYPHRAVVIYDGNCPFCRRQVQRLLRWDSWGHLAFVSLHDPRVALRYPDLSHQELMTQMYLVSPRGDRYAGAGAFRYLSRHLPWLWLVAPLLHLPGTYRIWNFLYQVVAQRRYRLPGERTCTDGVCQIEPQRRQ